jgi:hypothetical protein
MHKCQLVQADITGEKAQYILEILLEILIRIEENLIGS